MRCNAQLSRQERQQFLEEGLTRPAAADHVDLSVATLNKLASTGGGPRYYAAYPCRYLVADLDRWRESREKRKSETREETAHACQQAILVGLQPGPASASEMYRRRGVRHRPCFIDAIAAQMVDEGLLASRRVTRRGQSCTVYSLLTSNDS